MRLVEGWTADIDLSVKNPDGSAYDLTGAGTPALIIKDRDGATVDTTGDVTVPAPATQGIVRWSPDATDLLAPKSPFYLHIQITKSGKDTFVPQGSGLQITVTPQGRP